jgi:hypothetical protein
MGDSMPTAHEPAATEPAPPAPDAPLQEWTAYILALQAPACRILGSELYAHLLERAAEDVRAGGPAWAVLAPHATRDTGAALALRFMAAVHRVVLERRAPELALYFPSVGGTAHLDGAWPVLRSVLVDQADRLQELTGRPCQTNEVGRCAALVGGFLLAARESGLPLRLLEIGASGGLNLRWDRYFYADADGGSRWGDPESPVQLVGHWEVPAALTTQEVTVASRAGCDPRPIDPSTDEGRLGLTASVWGDQPRRFSRLAGALEVAATVPVEVQQAPAIQWLPAHLEDRSSGAATVVYHSVVLQYMDPREREDVVALLQRAGQAATPDAPLYWLRMEPERPLRAMAVRLTAWPGGSEDLVASAGAHGDPLRWRAKAP